MVRDGAGRDRDGAPAARLDGKPGTPPGLEARDCRQTLAQGAHGRRHEHFAVVRNSGDGGIASHGLQLNIAHVPVPVCGVANCGRFRPARLHVSSAGAYPIRPARNKPPGHPSERRSFMRLLGCPGGLLRGRQAGAPPIARLTGRRDRQSRACGRAGVTFGAVRPGGIIWHDLRRTFATRLRAHGVHEYDIQDLLGHSKPGVTKVYARATLSVLEAAVEKITKPVGQIVEFGRRAG